MSMVTRLSRTTWKTVMSETPLDDDTWLAPESLDLGVSDWSRQAIDIEAIFDTVELSRQVRVLLSALAPREEAVIRQHFGIDCEPLPLHVIGHDFNVTKERIRRIQLDGIYRLSRSGLDRLLESFFDPDVCLDQSIIIKLRTRLEERKVAARKQDAKAFVSREKRAEIEAHRKKQRELVWDEHELRVVFVEEGPRAGQASRYREIKKGDCFRIVRNDMSCRYHGRVFTAAEDAYCKSQGKVWTVPLVGIDGKIDRGSLEIVTSDDNCLNFVLQWSFQNGSRGNCVQFLRTYKPSQHNCDRYEEWIVYEAVKGLVSHYDRSLCACWRLEEKAQEACRAAHVVLAWYRKDLGDWF